MKAAEITTKSDKELADMITSTRTKIADAHVELRTKQVANVRAIRGLKRDLARALTIQSERELASLEVTENIDKDEQTEKIDE